MKQFLTVFATFVFGVIMQAQVSIQTKIPPIVPGSEITIEIKITKGAVSNFAKFQIDVPEGAYLSEGDNKTGSFSFEKSRAKIIWVNIPNEPEFTVSMKLNPGTATGMGTINQKFYYLDNGVRKEVEAMPLNLNFSGNTAVISTSHSAPEETLNTAAAPAETAAVATPSAPEVTESTNAIVERTTAAPAEEPAKTETSSKESSAESIKKLKEQFDAANQSASNPEPPVEEPAVAKTATPPTLAAPSAPATPPGVTYKIQIGAYGENPGMMRYKALKDVKIMNENNFYKVLVGNFKTREEAMKRKEELLQKGFKGFVVIYQNGARIR